MAKMKAGIRGWIVKLYKSGSGIDEIHTKVKVKMPKITKVTINAVITKHLINLADELWAIAVKVKFGWKCAISHKTDNLEAHHLVRRGNYTHRWTVENGISLNSGWHTLGGKISAHGATDVTDRFRDWMIANRPGQWDWFEQHRDDLSVKPKSDELLKIVKMLEGASKNGYQIEQREPFARGPAAK
jgi:hypothetical protein